MDRELPGDWTVGNVEKNWGLPAGTFRNRTEEILEATRRSKL
ncbi:hypothetical protein [[Clostridium] aminophilum]